MVPGGLSAAQVFAANGSNEVLQCICLAYGGAGRSAATFEPTYALHSHIARTCGTAVICGERTDDFELDLAEVERVVLGDRPTITFLCSPNNPTGGIEAPATVTAVLEMVESVGGLLVLDEAYGQFAPQSALAMIDEDRPLVVTRTFSKTWSAAALRLGYLVGPSWIVEELEKVVLPYHLDAVKQVAGSLALEFAEEMAARVAALVEERGRMMAALEPMAVTTWPSAANFMLLRPDELGGQELWERLLERGVLVRNCASWPRSGELLAAHARNAEGERRVPVRPGRVTCLTRWPARSADTSCRNRSIVCDAGGRDRRPPQRHPHPQRHRHPQDQGDRHHRRDRFWMASGRTDCTTGLPFFDHMLDQLGRHSGMDLTVTAAGDLAVDAHHTVEDTGILIGTALARCPR